MKKSAIFFVLLSVMVWADCVPAFAASAPVFVVEDSVAGLGNLNQEEVRRGIIEAGAVRGWKMRELSENELEATLYIRSYMVKVLIPYSDKSYSILYKDSTNMRHNAEKNTIHSSYTRWVRNLDKDITQKLQSQSSR